MMHLLAATTLALSPWSVATEGSKADDAPKTIPFVEIRHEGPIEFDRHVYPFLANKCVSCHDAVGGVAEAKLDMTTVANLAKGGKRGPSFIAGKGAESNIVRMSSHALKPIMPPKGKNSLTPVELSTLKRWIDEGALPGKNLEPANMEELPLPTGVSADVQASLCVDFSRDGKWVGFGKGGRAAAALVAQPESTIAFGNFPEVVQSLRFSPVADLVAVGSYGRIDFFAPSAGPPEGFHAAGEIGGFTGRIFALEFSPDGKILAAASGLPALPGELSLWEVPGGKKIGALPDAHSDSILGLAFSRSGARIATAGADKFIRVFEVPSLKKTHQFEGHGDHVLAVAWLDADKQIVSASADGSIRTWNVETGEPIRTVVKHPKPATALRVVPGKNEIIAASADRRVRWINPADGRQIRDFGDAQTFLQAVAVSPDGKTIAAVGVSGVPKFWRTDK